MAPLYHDVLKSYLIKERYHLSGVRSSSAGHLRENSCLPPCGILSLGTNISIFEILSY